MGLLPYLTKHVVNDIGYTSLQVDSEPTGELKCSVLADCDNRRLFSKEIVPKKSICICMVVINKRLLNFK